MQACSVQIRWATRGTCGREGASADASCWRASLEAVEPAQLVQLEKVVHVQAVMDEQAEQAGSVVQSVMSELVDSVGLVVGSGERPVVNASSSLIA